MNDFDTFDRRVTLAVEAVIVMGILMLFVAVWVALPEGMTP